ncbi:MAG TPA: Wzz/FepE/Etk N-terminal domain-containing protein [Niabella sp.]|nr:Wzz/FepE/Etk N-terminal domain-containing protein [Niabella sp.]
MDNNMQEKVNSDFAGIPGEETSLKGLILSIRDWIRYFWSKWYIILLFGILGAVLGLTYAFLKKPVYTATTSFVLETGGSKSGLAAYAGIASSFGIDLGLSGGGLFEGENILELYRSRNMISSALLSEGMFDGKKHLLIDRFIDYNNLKERWGRERPILKSIKFIPNNKYVTKEMQLVHDSIMGLVVKNINKNFLKVEKKDKKSNIITVTVNSQDELFAKYFNEKLVENVNKFYLSTKSKKSLENVTILQRKADSVHSLMTGAIYSAATVADATPNQNPTRMTQRIAPIQNARANAEINQEILGTILQNLELSKISLLKETPLIQIVDEPVLPLEKKKTSKLIALIIGGIIGGIIVLGILTTRKYIRDTLVSVN